MPAVFLDRDGTINQERGHIKTPEDLVLLSGAGGAIRRLNESQYLTIIVTNQSVIARGKCTEDEMDVIHNRLQLLIGEYGASIDRIYYCPHYPDECLPEGRKELNIICDCRKPQPGLITRAAKDMNIDLSLSWMVGDMISDIQAAKRVGVRSILLPNPGGSENNCSVLPDAKCRDLNDAVRYILDYSTN